MDTKLTKAGALLVRFESHEMELQLNFLKFILKNRRSEFLNEEEVEQASDLLVAIEKQYCLHFDPKNCEYIRVH